MKYFLVPNVKNFLVDDSRSCDGTDVLFAVDCDGYPGHIWFLYEEGYVHRGLRREMLRVFDTAIAMMAGLMIIPAVFAFSGGDPDTLQAGPSLDVYHDSEGVCRIWDLEQAIGILFFLLVLICCTLQARLR